MEEAVGRGGVKVYIGLPEMKIHAKFVSLNAESLIRLPNLVL